MRYILSIISLVLLLGVSGCGYKEGVATAAQKSSLYFSGNTKSIEVSIDSGEHFSVKAGQTNQYGVKPGKHLVEVYRNGIIIIKREVFLSDGVAKEIEVQ